MPFIRVLWFCLSSYDDDVRIRNVLGPPPSELQSQPDFTTEEVLDTVDDYVYDEPTPEAVAEGTSPKASPRRLDTNETTKNEWVAMEDPRTGYNYYMNRKTMKIAWSRLEMFRQEMSSEEESSKEAPLPSVEVPSPVAYHIRKTADPGFTSDAWEDPSASRPIPMPMPALPGIQQSSSTLALSEARRSPMPNRAPPSAPSGSDSIKITNKDGSQAVSTLESRKGSIATPVASSNNKHQHDPSIPTPPPSAIPPKKPYRASIFMRPLPSPRNSSNALTSAPSSTRPTPTSVAMPTVTTTNTTAAAVPAPPPPMPAASNANKPGTNRPFPKSSNGSSTAPFGGPPSSPAPSIPVARTGNTEFADIDIKPRSGSTAPAPTKVSSQQPKDSLFAASNSSSNRSNGDIDVNSEVINVSSMFRRPVPASAAAKKQAHQSAYVGAPAVTSTNTGSSRTNPIPPITKVPASTIVNSHSNSSINGGGNKVSPPSSVTSQPSTRAIPPRPPVGLVNSAAPPMPTTPNRPHAGSRPPAYAPPNPAVLVTMNNQSNSSSRANRISFRASISRVAPPTWGEIIAENEAYASASSSAPAHSSGAPIASVPSYGHTSPPSARNPAIGPAIGLPPQRAIPAIPKPPPSLHSTHNATGAASSKVSPPSSISSATSSSSSNSSSSSPQRISNASPSRVGGIRTSHSAHTLSHHTPSPYAQSLPGAQMEAWRSNNASSSSSSSSPHTMKLPSAGGSPGGRQRPALTKAYTSVGPIPQPPISSGAGRPALPADLKAQINFFQLEGFATRFFKSQKRGFFRRAVPIRERLKWTQGALKTPLLKLKPDLAKKALVLFKWIQICMGDRELTTTQEERYKLMVEIFDLGLNIAALRDEIFCQLCKQTTLNPNADSNLRGWSLITLFLQYFTPTKDLEHWFMDYCREHEKNPQQEIHPYVTYALRVLSRGPSQSGSTLRVPEVDEVELALRNPIQPRLFGVTLQNVLESQQRHAASVPEISARPDFPYVITALTSIVSRLNGPTTEGIFRIPGSHMLCTKLRLQLEAGNYTGSGLLDPHVPASVLKWWLRDLEEPVIPAAFYNACLEAAKGTDAATACVRVVDSLPPLNKTVVYSIINFVQVLARPENVTHTKMAVGSLSIVFGPNLLRCQATEMMLVFEAQKWEQTFVTTLIKNLPSQLSP